MLICAARVLRLSSVCVCREDIRQDRLVRNGCKATATYLQLLRFPLHSVHLRNGLVVRWIPDRQHAQRIPGVVRRGRPLERSHWRSPNVHLSGERLGERFVRWSAIVHDLVVDEGVVHIGGAVDTRKRVNHRSWVYR